MMEIKCEKINRDLKEVSDAIFHRCKLLSKPSKFIHIITILYLIVKNEYNSNTRLCWERHGIDIHVKLHQNLYQWMRPRVAYLKSSKFKIILFVNLWFWFIKKLYKYLLKLFAIIGLQQVKKCSPLIAIN